MGVRLGLSGARRALVGVLVLGLGGGSIVALAPAAHAAGIWDVPEGLDGIDPRDWDGSAGPARTEWHDSPTIAPSPPDEQPALPESPPEYPAAEDWEVSLAEPGSTGEVVGDDSLAGPVEVGVAEEGTDGEAIPASIASQAEGKDLKLKMHDHATAQRVGVTGFVFELNGDGTSESAGPLVRSGDVPLELNLDYSGFADSFGGGFASRLRVVALPACVLESPIVAGCDTVGVPVKSRNDEAGERLIVDPADIAAMGDKVANAQAELDLTASALEDVSASAAAATSTASTGSSSSTATVMAVTSGTSSELGTYEATPLSMTGDWDVSPGSGEFSYSYPIDVPAPPGGQAPSVGLGYSSGAVDGLTNSSNPQAGQAGLGWSDFANAFIERSYESCAEAEVLPSSLWANLCFRNYNATISLGGVSGRLIAIDGANTQWRVQGDPGWLIERTAVAAADANGYFRESWKVTGPDGTQYSFGLHDQNPDASASTQSAWWVRVVSDHVGEPCWNAQAAVHWNGCNMAYRWMLDRVVDPDGNLTTYYYDRETGAYNAWPGVAERQPYIRSGYLKRIEYGGRAGAGPTQKPAVKVNFDVQYRCGYMVEACPEPTYEDRNNTTGFPDVPADLICPSSGPCTQSSQSFFSTQRYSDIRTEVLVGSSYQTVSQHNLQTGFHKYADETGDADYLMYLNWVQQTDGAEGPDNPVPAGAAYPKTSFDYTDMYNSVLHGDIVKLKIWRGRLTQVVNPSGGLIKVTFDPDSCSETYQPPGGYWDANTQPCFPVMYKDKTNGITRHGIFHKYRVLKVEELPRFGADTTVTQYLYSGGAAWAHNRHMGDAEQVKWGWNVWRGYGTVTITKGTDTSGYSKTKLRLFRGMDDDLLMTADGCVCGRRNESVSYLDGTAGPEDKWWLAGRTLEEQQLKVVGGVAYDPLTSTRYTYAKSDLIDPADPREEFRPTWSGVADVTERVWSSSTAFRERGTTTTYNANFQPATTIERGWLTDLNDDRCSLTTYVDNQPKGMVAYPAVNETRAGSDCTNGALLTRAETYYDDATTLTTAPTRGNPTWTRTKVDSTRWSETKMTYDDFGRPLTVNDPVGATSTTVYTPTTNVISTKTEVTNALGHKTTTLWDPKFQAPTRETDPNLNETNWKYDTLGRTTEVRRPSERTTTDPSFRFSYTLDEDDAGDPDLLPEKPPVVQTRQLQIYGANGPVFEDTWVVYDGFLRERQTQVPSPDSGKALVSETRYDARGQLSEEIAPEPVTGTAGSGMLSPTTWQNRMRHLYDEFGRETAAQWLVPGSTTSVESQTVTTYGTDTVTTTGPNGVSVRETADGLGRTTKVEEKDGANWVATQYQYDLADNLKKVIDPANNETAYTYDLAGLRTAQADPDRGAAHFEYDLAGRQTMAEDAAGKQIHTKYDVLGRPTERHADSLSGTLLASWTYDTVKLGLLTKSTRHTATGPWETTVNSYDDKNRATSTSLKVPDGIPGLSNTYMVTQSWDRADHPYDVGYPAVGGLAAETVRFGYNGFGLPATLKGAEDYVWSTVYDGRDRPVTTIVSPQDPNGPFGIRASHWWEYNSDQQMSRSYTWVPGSALSGGVVAERKPKSREDGLVTERDSKLNGASWRECYGYDDRARLTSTYTVAYGAQCVVANKGGGDQPFERTYTNDPDGKLTQRTEGTTTISYAYPAAGASSVRPHAPTQVGTRDYTWNSDGSLHTRTVTGGPETYNWDVEHLLSSVSGPSGTTGFVYDVDGQRLLRTNSDGSKTLSFAGHEVTANAAGTSVTATRSYSLDGKLIATRSPAGVDYMVSDEAGSVEGSMPSGGTTVSGSRRYDPYGQVRNEAGADFKTERGFLGQVEDSATGLSYLNARYYDTKAALFVSADPLFDTTTPKSLNPYTYGLGNPVNYSDPSGMASSALYGTELENVALRGQVKTLQGIVKQMGAQISELQDIVRKQNKMINDLITENNALRSIIAQQDVVIRRLQERVTYLEGVVDQQNRIIGKLRDRIQYLNGVIWKFSIHDFGPMLGIVRFMQIMAGMGVNFSGSRMDALRQQLGDARGVQKVLEEALDFSDEKYKTALTSRAKLQGEYNELEKYGPDPGQMSTGGQICYYGTQSHGRGHSRTGGQAFLGGMSLAANFFIPTGPLSLACRMTGN